MKQDTIEKNAPSLKIIATGLIVLLFSGFLAMRLTAEQTPQPTNQRALPVLTTTIKYQDGYMAKRAFTGKAVAGRTSNMAFELNGTVKTILVDVGSTVKTGQVLAELNTARLDANKDSLTAEYDEITASLKLAERTLIRTKKTFKQGHVSGQKMDEAEANTISLRARQKRLTASIAAIDVDLEKSTIRAPFSGIITLRNIDEGSVVPAGTSLLELTETSRIEAYIGMPPEHAIAIKNGAHFTLYDSRRKPIEGATLRSVVPVIEGQTRTMMVTFNLPPSRTASGELINAVISNWQMAGGAWLPLRALSSDVRGLWRVYKVVSPDNNPYVQFENVQILYSESKRAFVTGTISNGDIIISDGLARLAPGQHISLPNTSDKRS